MPQVWYLYRQSQPITMFLIVLLSRDDGAFLPIVRRARPTTTSEEFLLFEPAADSDSDSDHLSNATNNDAHVSDAERASLIGRPMQDLLHEDAHARKRDKHMHIQNSGACIQLRATLKRYMLQFSRSWVFMLMQLLLPTIQVSNKSCFVFVFFFSHVCFRGCCFCYSLVETHNFSM
jgi:hypothetical protein